MVDRDGYRDLPDGGSELVDPELCPSDGHPIVAFARGGVTHCNDRSHRPHHTWKCGCGQEIFRWRGAFWGELECLSRDR